MNSSTERRSELSGHIHLEARAENEGQRLVGYAAMFDTLSQDLGGFREQIRQGAFARSLEGSPDVRALWNHNTQYVLGRTSAGTMSLREDEKGLRVEIEPPDSSWARDLMTSVERGDVSQMSFGFRVRAGGQEFDENDEGEILRTLTDVELMEVSPVTFPAYPDTSIAARSLEAWRQEVHGGLPSSVRRRRMQLAHRERGLTR